MLLDIERKIINMSYKIGLISLGCEKNRVDAERILWKLKEAGYDIVQNELDADVVIVNTCGFIDDAKKESIDEIFNMIRQKDENKSLKIIVTGCLSERYKEKVLKEIPEIDAVLGIGANDNIVEIVEKVINGEKVELFPDKEKLSLSGGRVRTTPSHYAYVKIADGCDNRCSYCAIPLIRGKFRSRSVEDVLDEVKELIENGVKEIILIAQDTTRYGEDINTNLTTLLREICKIDGEYWIRILYCYPDRISDELIDLMAEEDKILKYIDIPLQHCSGKVLKDMNRKGNSESLKLLIEKIRDRILNVVIRTTIITGFPGENDEDFEELISFVREMKFERLGCFAYSREEDTKAYDMSNQIDDDVKKKRQEIVMEAQFDINKINAEKQIGKQLQVIVDKFDEDIGSWVGRSYMDAPDVDGMIIIQQKNGLHTGDIVHVRISKCNDYDLIGEIL